MKSENLKLLLDNLYNTYKRKYSSHDPVWIVHRFTSERDIEIAGLISSSYAYGHVEQINGFLNKLFNQIGNKPYEFTVNFTKRKDKKFLNGLNYRFNSDADLLKLFDNIKGCLKKYGSLKSLFLEKYTENDENVLNSLTNFCTFFNTKHNKNSHYRYLIPNPLNKSACKRINLYLRWMVRKDEIDTGIWREVDKSKLIMPVDIHVARISKRLGLVKRKSVDIKFAIELTNNLKLFDPLDPVKYDFALCHEDMNNIW